MRGLSFTIVGCVTLVVVVSLGLIGCGDDKKEGQEGREPCSAVGSERDCSACAEGLVGTETCQEDGFWGTCVCPTAGGTGGTIVTGGTRATGGTGGGGGTGGSTMIDAGPLDGGGGTSNPDAASATDAAEEGGVLDSAVVEGGVLDSAVVEGGVLDSAVVEGGVLDSAVVEGGGDASLDVPPYGECTASDECAGDNAICYRAGGDTVSATSPGFCTVECDTADTCPDPTGGTAVKACSESSSRCLLECDGQTCPDGMDCEDFVVLQACQYPSS